MHGKAAPPIEDPYRMSAMPPSMDAAGNGERLLSIGDLAHATGIAPDTLRA